MPVLPRGAATSLSGQTVGEALILDLSKYLNRIGIVDRDRMTVRVEPGVVLDRLNAHLRPLGLMFGPDVSTSDRATIGGMIGNNSAGARSLRYGKTVDHVRSLDVVLDDGDARHVRPGRARGPRRRLRPARPRRAGSTRASATRSDRHRSAIVDAFPEDPPAGERVQPRRVRPRACRSGPAGWVDEPWAFNLARLIVGSEGTLAVVAGAELKVVPIPPAQGLVILSFATIPAALDRLAEIVATGPVGRRDARPDDPRPRRRATPTTPGASTSPRAAPPPSSPPSSTPIRPRSWPTAPRTWPAGSRGGPASWASARA